MQLLLVMALAACVEPGVDDLESALAT